MDITEKIQRIEEQKEWFDRHLRECRLCPRECAVNRAGGHMGVCGVSDKLTLYAAFLHQGEEPAISGSRGSGTLFFSGCSLHCLFCQNYQFSHENRGTQISADGCAEIMVKLQAQGAHNINLVTGTHFLPQILESLRIAYIRGLTVPVVWNTSGYEKNEVIGHLGGVIDVYLADMKYFSPEIAQLGSHTPKYPFYAQDAIKTMYSQKNGVLYDKEQALILSGLVIRHLVLPGAVDDSLAVLNWIKEHTPEALISVMFQYRPYFQAHKIDGLNRPLTLSEYQRIIDFLDTLDFDGWVQEYNPREDLAGVHFPQKIDI
ncbi:MAG: radical SAM protein [Candidatus Omnitrophica bacterium]|nr:radical SAM protein [Candidatus Omnitrophota bacterium]